MSEDRGYPRLEPPAACTASCARYFAEHGTILGFLGFVGELATRQDEVVRIAHHVLQASEGGAPALIEAPDDPGGAVAALRRYRTQILQMVLSREVDNYLTYLAELLAEAFRTRPEMLRSAEQVPVDFVLAHDRMEDVIDALAERRVERLSSRGTRRLRQHLEDLGLQLFITPAEAERVDRIVQDRNAIVHSRGRVSRYYEERFPESGLRPGDVLELSFDSVMADVGTLADAVVSLDQRAIQKWGLRSLQG